MTPPARSRRRRRHRGRWRSGGVRGVGPGGAPESLRAFARAAVDAAGGRLDVVVHNAALWPPVDTLSLTDDDLEAALAVNVRAPHVLTAALAPAMVERGQGALVVIGSWMAHVGHAFVGLYSATAAAEIQRARSWAAEFGAAECGLIPYPPVPPAPR